MHVYLGLNWSNNMIKLNIESLLQIFCGIKNQHNFQSHEHEEESKPQHHIFPGKAYCSKPLYHILYIPQGIMKQLHSKLFWQERSVHQLIVSHFLTKLANPLANFLPPDSLPYSRNSWWMQSLITNNFSLPQMHYP